MNNTARQRMANTEFEVIDQLGFYRISPEEYKEAVTAAVANVRQVIDQVKKVTNINWETVIQPLEVSAERLQRIWWQLSQENLVASTPEIREVHDELLGVVTNLHTEEMQDQELYNIYLTLKNSPEFTKLSKAQQAIITDALRGFKLNGVDLPLATREKLKEIHERLSAKESDFTNNVLDATQDWTYHVTTAQKFLLEGLPERLIAAAKEKASADNISGWVFTLDAPTYFDVVSYAQNRQLREEFYIAYNGRASNQGPMAGKYDNTQNIADILELRQQIAQLTGHANYAEYSLVPKMASSTDEVNAFLNGLVTKVLPYAKQDYQALQDFAKEQGFAPQLEGWDLAYYSERMREQKYQFSEEELRVYFPVPKVLQGLFSVVQKLFGISFQEVKNFASWDPAVQMYEATDQHGQLRGYFYIDLYTRNNKRGGAWMAECVGRMRLQNNSIQTPIAFLTCNFPPPQPGKPGLLTHQEVVTLFHEFGHTAHHILSQIEYFSVAGLQGVEWDAIELPSQLLENWAWEWQVIEEITENIFTQEPMPKALFDKLLASKNFQAGLFLNKHLIYSIFDLRIHENLPKDKGKSAHEILEEVRKEIAVIPAPASNRFENTFTHIFSGDGYSAGYYSYLWAEVLACDAYAKFTAKQLFDATVGAEFLTKFLERGGSEPAMDLFVNFLGRKPNVDALLKHYALIK